MVSVVQSVFFLALFLVITTSIFITSLFQFKSILPYLFACYLISLSNILLTGEIAGVVGLLNNRLLYLAIHLFLLFISIILWKKMKSPPLIHPFLQFAKTIRTINIWEQIKKHIILVFTGLGVVMIYLLGAVLVVEIPPNNYDSMTCHMARIGYWLQNGNFLPWSTWFPLQVDYPINAQIPVLWSIVFWRTDTFANTTLWFATLFSIMAVYGIARLLNRTRAQSLFACLIFALFPEILLQSTTTMPHLFGSALVIIAFYFLFLAFHEKSKLFIYFSGLSIALALGVHLIVWIMLPGYALTALILAIKNRKDKLKPIQVLVTSAIIFFLLFSSYMYLQNFILWGQPFGRSTTDNPWTPRSNSSLANQESYWLPKNVLKYTYFNLSRYIFASFDLTGLPDEIADPLYDLRDSIAIPLFDLTHNPRLAGEFDISARPKAVSENWTWFGLVGFILFFPLMTIEFIRGIKKRDAFKLTLILNIVLYALIWSAVLSRENSWTIYSSRYFVASGMFFAPFISIVYQKNIVYKPILLIIGFASMYIGFQTMVLNYAKPLISNGAIFKWSRLEKMYNVGWDQLPMIEAIEEKIPRGTLGLALTPSLMEYPFFGEYFHRTLIPIYPYSLMQDQEWLKNNNIDWIYSCVDIEKPVGFVEEIYFPLQNPIGISTECTLFRRQ